MFNKTTPITPDDICTYVSNHLSNIRIQLEFSLKKLNDLDEIVKNKKNKIMIEDNQTYKIPKR